METAKAITRRIRSGFFARYLRGRVLDVGAGNDPLTPWVEIWERPQGDATYLSGVPDATYDTVFSSHCLEHLQFPWDGLFHWFRVLKPGGWLIISLPHRDLYEKREQPPSLWNGDHKFFYLPEESIFPGVLGLWPLIQKSLPTGAWRLESLAVEAQGYRANGIHHPQGELSIEAVIQKRA